jgi:hypothetical protein
MFFNRRMGRAGIFNVRPDFAISGDQNEHANFQSAPRRILPWRFERVRVHLIEAGWVEG